MSDRGSRWMLHACPSSWNIGHRDITAGKKSPEALPPEQLTWRLGHHFEEPKEPYKAVSSDFFFFFFFNENLSMGPVSDKLGRYL